MKNKKWRLASIHSHLLQEKTQQYIKSQCSNSIPEMKGINNVQNLKLTFVQSKLSDNGMLSKANRFA